ncbi:MAG: hypothetical protein WKG06_37325 [Segetibacter sp.]
MPWELTGNSGTSPDIDFLGTTDNKSLVIKTDGKEALRIDPSGNVGLGMSATSSKLEIAAQDALQIIGFQPFLTLADSNSGFARARIQNANGDINFFTEASFATGIPPMKVVNSSGTLQITAQDALQIIGFQPFLTLADSNSGFARARIQNANGDINFFTEASFATGIPPMKVVNSSGTVQITAQDALQIIGFQPFLTLADSNSGFARARIQNANGDINFFTEASFATGIPPMKIVNGSGNVEVTGDIILHGADCAEDFDVLAGETVEPGTVMVIDQDGALKQSEKAYDKRVAGVISGAGDFRPGIILDKQPAESNRKPIALVGKVYCKVDAQDSPIEIGDLLTTSSTLGYAMRANDPFKAFGAVIGKALQPLEAGQGLIPILIALQ